MSRYDPEECTRLAVEAREDDERMTQGVAVAGRYRSDDLDDQTQQFREAHYRYAGSPMYVVAVAASTNPIEHDAICFATTGNGPHGAADARAIARTRNNLRATADQLEAARAEIERLTREVSKCAEDINHVRRVLVDTRKILCGDAWENEGTVEAAKRVTTERDAMRPVVEAGDLIADLCGGVTGADDDDRVGTIKAHFSNRPSMWLRDAMIEAVDAYRAARGKAGGS